MATVIYVVLAVLTGLWVLRYERRHPGPASSTATVGILSVLAAAAAAVGSAIGTAATAVGGAAASAAGAVGGGLASAGGAIGSVLGGAGGAAGAGAAGGATSALPAAVAAGIPAAAEGAGTVLAPAAGAAAPGAEAILSGAGLTSAGTALPAGTGTVLAPAGQAAAGGGSWFDKLQAFTKTPGGRFAKDTLLNVMKGDSKDSGAAPAAAPAPQLHPQLGQPFQVPQATDPLAGLMSAINQKRARLAALSGGVLGGGGNG